MRGSCRPGRYARRSTSQARGARVDLRSRALPLEVSGRILGGLPGARRTITVAVNRRACGIQRTYALRGRESFAVIVPDGCLREGRNEVRVFAVAGGGRRPRLAPLPLG